MGFLGIRSWGDAAAALAVIGVIMGALWFVVGLQVESQIQPLRSDIATLRGDVGVLRSDISSIKTDVREIRSLMIEHLKQHP